MPEQCSMGAYLTVSIFDKDENQVATISIMNVTVPKASA